MKNVNILLTEVAILETKMDHMQTEMDLLDQLLIKCGFPDGIASLKLAAAALLQDEAK